MEAVVVAEGIRKTYGETVALAGVSLSVERGEVFALIGPNGAGKTTLVRALTGTTVPDSGTASVLDATPTAVDRNRLGVLPQDFSPPDRLTARELLAYYAGLYESARDPDAVLEAVGLAESGDTWYEDLSGGQQRRVCVGTALVNDPDVCVLDEPTTGIDPAGRRTVWRLIESLAATGTSVVLTTHDMAEAERLGDRVGLLANGELVATGTPEALIDTHAGSNRLTVELETESDGEAETPFETPTLEGLEYPIESRPDTNEIVVRDISATDIGTIVTALEQAGIEYTELTWAQPDLEDVYLSLAQDVEAVQTGRSDGLERTARDESVAFADGTHGGDEQ